MLTFVKKQYRAMITFNFNLKAKKEKEELVIIVAYHNGTRIKVSTKQKAYVQAWDEKKQRCHISTEYADRINRTNRKLNKFLDTLESDIKSDLEINDFYQDKVGIYGTSEFYKSTLQRLVNRIIQGEQIEEEKKKITPLTFFKQYVISMDKRIVKATGTFTNPRTIKHHETVLKRFTDFFYEKNIKDDFTVFDEAFSTLFEQWAYMTRNYSSNTIPASFSILKVWLNEAVKEGLLNNLTYKGYKSKGTNVDNIYLTANEIERLYRLDISNLKAKGLIDIKSRCEETRDLFVVGCWSGLRLSDLRKLNDANINLDKSTLTVVTEKTKEMVVIPLHPFVREIYLKYGKHFPAAFDKGKSIAHLQHLGQLAEIKDSITVKENRGGKIITQIYPKYQLIMNHTARRSFATNLYLAGAPTISIMKLTGHTTEANFMKYIKVTKEQNAELMRKYFK